MPLNPPITSWAGRRVWVVGASSGIGAALAEELSRQGAQVIASARREDALKALTPQAKACVAVDISQDESFRNAANTVFDQLGGVDVVFWVAAVYHPMKSTELDLAAVRETFEVNVLAGYRGLKSVLDRWLPQNTKGHWVWVSSVAGFRGLPLASAYGASKAALTHLAETNYLELKPRGIAVSVVLPGFVQTRLTDKNDFSMPAIITPIQAAKETLAGLARGQFAIHYPKRFTRMLQVLRLLPYWLYFRIISKTVK